MASGTAAPAAREKQDQKTREANYDLLRVLCSAAVVVLHVTASYRDAYFDTAFFGALYRDHYLFTTLCEGLCRFAVPCFLMLSGAFLLPNEKNADCRTFYKKALHTLGAPTLLFSALYFFWSMLKAWRAVLYKGKPAAWLWTPLLNWLRGAPYGHMWYLYALIGLYLLVPAAVRLRQAVPEKSFSRGAWIFSAAAMLSLYTSTHTLEWDMGRSFCLFGYFLIGDRIRTWAKQQQAAREASGGLRDGRGGAWADNVRGLCLILAGALVMAAASLIRYAALTGQIALETGGLTLLGPESPAAALASALVFAGFSLLRIQKGPTALAGKTLLIYLIHAAVWDVAASLIIRRYALPWDNRLVIPLASAAMYAVSLLLAIFYQRFFTYSRKGNRMA